MKKRFIMAIGLSLALTLSACGVQIGQNPSEPPDARPTESRPAVQLPAVPEEKTYIECSGGYATVVFVEMSDGAVICCMVVKPEREGQFPTVVTQSCYQKPTEEFTAEYISKCVADSAAFVEAGYTFVMVQTRGTGNSPYESYLPYVHDTADELQVFDWIRGQDFYNGEIFCNGMSYMGFMSMSHLYAPHSDIKAVSMQCPVSTRYDAWYQNGFLKVGLMGYWQSWMHRPAGFDATALGNTMDMSLFNTFPYLDWPVTMYGYQEEYWTDILTHPKYSDWWRTEAAGGYIYDAVAAIDIPVLLYDNFYDIFFEDSFALWNSFSPEQRAQSAFIVNQFGHTTADTTGYEDWPLNIGNSFITTYNADYSVDFFNSVRTGGKPEKVILDSVTYYPVDGDGWFVEPEVLTDGPNEHVLYLNAGTLDETADKEMSVSYVYDPMNPAAFQASDENGGNGTNGYRGLGTEPEPGARQDVISFLGEPVEKETYIKGRLFADIKVSSACEDTCFYVRVNVVKDGVAYNLREDITSLSHQLGTYTPGDKASLSFETGPVVCKLNPEDYLRVDITSSAAGMYSIHTNVAGDQWEIIQPKIANNTIYTGVSTLRYYTEDLNA